MAVAVAVLVAFAVVCFLPFAVYCSLFVVFLLIIVLFFVFLVACFLFLFVRLLSFRCLICVFCCFLVLLAGVVPSSTSKFPCPLHDGPVGSTLSNYAARSHPRDDTCRPNAGTFLAGDAGVFS